MELKEYTVEELVNNNMIEKPIDGNHGNKHPKSSDYVEIGIPFIMVSDINNGRINYNTCKFITEEQRNVLNKGFSRKGDILLSHKATIGVTCIVDDLYPEIVITPQLTCYRIKNGINKYYLKYYFDSPYFQNILKNWATSGSTRAYLGITAQLKLPILLPELEIQNKISKILSLIDRKIELNMHTNNNLQELLLSQYKLYFENKESNGKLKDIVEKMNRTIKKDKINKILKYYPIDVLPKNNIVLQDGKNIEEAQSSLIEFNKNEILVGAMRVYFHRVCLTNSSGITRNTTFVLKPKKEDYLYYALLTLYQDSFIDYASITSKGTTMPYAVWENVCSEFDIYIPTEEELEDFNIICKSIINKMNINQAENQNLGQIRDTLLPKLMNGEIDLDKIEI